MQNIDLSSLPYSKRQFITVMDDVVVEATRKAKSDMKQSGAIPDWVVIARTVLDLLIGSSIVRTATTLAVIQAAFMHGAEAQKRGIPVIQISTTKASQPQFPPGNPRLNVLYVGHPTDERVYYPVADFHRVTFEHKMSEASWLLTCLGATRMSVECVRGLGGRSSPRSCPYRLAR